MNLEKSTGYQQTLKADLWLLLVCVFWGASFPLVKKALQDNQISPFLFIAIRFWIGAIILLPIVLTQKTSLTSDRLLRGSVLGLFMFLGMLFQTLGLEYTKAFNSAFITSMAVVIVPVLVILIERRLPKLSILLAVLLATIGLFLLTQSSVMGFNKGDLFTLISAISFAFEIVFIKLLVRQNESLMMAFIMIGTTALLASLGLPLFALFEKLSFSLGRDVLIGLGFVSVFCTALGFYIQVHWQPRTSTIKAALIYTLEPIFASIFVWILLKNERSFNWGKLLGGGLIVSGMLIAELKQQNSQ